MINLRRVTCFVCLLFLFFIKSQAGIETIGSLPLSGSQITSGATRTAQDNKPHPSATDMVAGASGRVILSVDHASNVYFSSDYTVKVGLQLTSYDINNVSQVVTTELVVNYSPFLSYNDKSIYVADGSHKLTVLITYVKDGSNVAIPAASVPQNLSLEVEQSTERYYQFNTATVTGSLTSALNTTSNELNIRWDVIPGAEAYELEWTHVNDYGESSVPLTSAAVFCDFRQNSTRVRLTENHYPISLIFDQGYVVYRVRGVGRSFADLNKELFGAWSGAESGAISSYTASHVYQIINTARHEFNKNWQYSSSYAEDGKKKEVVSYFDGSLRNRQSVTKINTDDKVVIGETVYDFQGRGAIQVLPTPTAASLIRFYPDYNLSAAGALPPYSRADFDLDSGSPCVSPTAGMSSTSGSSNYYSPGNPDKTGVQAYVPDAKLFPFTQIEYTPDNTGRIRRQSGVGADHQLGTDHETKYFYGQPEQVQLDRMFGSEVGEFKHYKKNMVVDANGQISVSYLDQQGRVVATSLAGNPPSNVTSLSHATDPLVTLTVDYLKSSRPGKGNDIIDNSLIFSKELIVATAGTYTFSYDVTLPQFTPCSLNTSLCYDCIYDLDISVKNSCGTDMFSPAISKRQVGNIAEGSFDFTCGTAITFNATPTPVTAFLPVGTYTILKKLTISEAGINAYINNFFAATNTVCITPFSTFTTTAMAQMDFTTCDQDCDQCVALLGPYSAHNEYEKSNPATLLPNVYDPNYVYMTQEEYDAAKRECMDPCKPANLCQAEYEMLLSDVSPGGQYAKYEINSSGDVLVPDVLSLLYDHHVLAFAQSPSAFWRNPDPEYKEADGTTQSRITVTLINGTYYPAVQSGETTAVAIDGSEYILPDQLADVKDFINLFSSHRQWAKSLVKYHPEYKYYEWCIKNDDPTFSKNTIGSPAVDYTSDGYDDLLRSHITYQNALAAGLLTTTSNTDLKEQDPYFLTGYGSAANPNAIMGLVLTNYHNSGQTLKQVSASGTRCGTTYYGPCSSSFGSGTNDAIKDREWQLYRDMYLAEKQKLQQIAADEYARAHNGSNSCIGIKDKIYNPWHLGFFGFNNTNLHDPCGVFTWFQYRNKIKRFNNGTDVIPGVNPFGDPAVAGNLLGNNVNYNMYLQTGQCPTTLDLEFLLDDLSRQGKLLSNTDLVPVLAFTKKLYDLFDLTAQPHTSFNNYFWVPSAPSNILTASINRNSVSGTTDGTITLTLPAGSVWTGIKRFSKIRFVNEAAGITYFTVKAFFIDPAHPTDPWTEKLVSGTIDKTSINTCTFPENCGPSKKALQFQNLFNTLLANNEFTNSNVNLLTIPVGATTNPYLSLFANNKLIPYNQLEWHGSALGDGTFVSSDGVTTISCGIGFDFVNSGYSISDIQFFANIRPNELTTAYCDIDAWVVDAVNGDHFEPMHVTTSGCFEFKECTPPPTLSCTGPEYKVNEQFMAGLNTFASQGALLTQGVTLPPDMQQAFPFPQCAALSWNVPSGNFDPVAKTLTVTVKCITLSPAAITDICNIYMQFSNISTANTYTNIASFSNLQVSTAGNGNQFTVIAHFADGTSQLLYCSSNCLELRTCEPCTTKEINYSENFDNVDPSAPGFTVTGATYTLPVVFGNNHIQSHSMPGIGEFLFVNPFTPFYFEKQLADIKPNTNYVLSFWLNKYDDRPWAGSGSVQFDGQTILTFSLNGQPWATWHKMSVNWNSGSSSGTVPLKIFIDQVRGTANDAVAIDDIVCSALFPCDDVIVDPTTIPTVPTKNECVETLTAIALANAHNAYNTYIKSLKDEFRNAYIAKCKEALENFRMIYKDREHHMTLYYYDQAGNLIKTVPPAGVVLVTNSGDLAQIETDRDQNKQTIFTTHTLQTRYEYNSLGQLIRQSTPDNDLTNKWDLQGLSVLPSGTNLRGINFSDEDNGFTVGDDGTNGVIYITSDGGKTWTPVSTLGVGNLNDVQFIGSTGYAIAEGGYLVKTVDGGVNWSIVPTGTTLQLNDIYFSSSSNGIVAGNSGILLQTSDGGQNWSVVSVPAAFSGLNFNDIHFIDAFNGFLAGDHATVLQTTDAGSTWTELPGVANPLNSGIKLNAIHFNTDKTGYVAGVTSAGDGFVAKATIDATSAVTIWSFPSTFSPAATGIAFTSVFYNGTKVYAAGTKGSIYISGDESFFSKVSSIGSLNPATSDITELNFPDASSVDQGYATARSGQIIKSSSNGSAWTASNVAVGTPLNGLYFDPANPTTGFVAGNGGVIFQTTNGGTSWSSLTNVNLPKLKASCTVGSTAYAVGEGGGIVKSSDNGSSWTTVNNTSGSSDQLNGVAFENANTGIAVGASGTIIKITGGGSSVTLMASPSSQDLNDIRLIPGTATYVSVGNAGDILKGTTTGFTLQTVGANNLNSVYFVNGQYGYACGSNGAVLKTVNGGTSWAATAGATGVAAVLRKVYFKDNLTGYVMGDGGVILKTTDGGDNWHNQSGTVTGDLYTAAFTSTGHALIAGSGAQNLSSLNDESFDFSARFWYDRLGRLIVSQNTKQFNKTPHAYSYTAYDALGRIVQVAEIATATDVNTLMSNHGVLFDDAAFASWLTSGAKTEITSTTYDQPAPNLPAGFTQDNLRTRVSTVNIDENGDGNFEHATYFTYDIHGNVKSLVQDNSTLAAMSQNYKRTDYDYDLVSGNVNAVKYQAGQPDAFYHKYEYDADNRITNTYTSRNNLMWDQDAKYFYYDHGPLARTEIADQKVQGMDYAYTIQGWIKGVNSNNLNTANDIGKDAKAGINASVARDAYGYSLNYFTNDYKAINDANILPTDHFIASTSNALYLPTKGPSLFNGNISSMVTSINDLTNPGSPVVSPQLTAYKYDQLNRIKEMNAYRDINLSGNAWGAGTTDESYKETFDYDPNGNILTLNRNGILSQGLDMDKMTYIYKTKANGYDKNTNQLVQVLDPVLSTDYSVDIDGQGVNNYTYDEIGNLKSDVQEEIETIEWTVYGKIKRVTRIGTSTKPDLEFAYDASGNRVMKWARPRTGSGYNINDHGTKTFYARDAQGNVMAVYETKIRPCPVQTGCGGPELPPCNPCDPNPDVLDLFLKEHHIYGSSRIGLVNSDLNLTIPPPATPNIFAHLSGKKNYELGNHLGNVLAVVTDIKRGVDDVDNTTGLPPADGLIDSYNADIISSNDYYAFGMLMPGRKFEGATRYRYGFNGKEKTDEMNGSGNMYDYGARIYNPRLGKFLSIDPLFRSYPWYTPFQFSGNQPIWAIDLDGLEENKTNDGPNQQFLYTDPEKPKVLIDPGHGDQPGKAKQVDPGAVSSSTNPQAYEKDLALLISKSIQKHLNESPLLDQDATLTREGDHKTAEQKLQWRKKKAEDIAAAIFVSIHLNSDKVVFDEKTKTYADDECSRGFVVLYNPKSSTSQELANEIAKTQSTIPLINTSGTDQRKDLFVLNTFKGDAAVLIEVGFITNTQDRNAIKNYSDKIGKEIAQGILKFVVKNTDYGGCTQETCNPPDTK